jgi:hypothetical protein
MKINFITNNEEIKNGLLGLGIREFTQGYSSQENRQLIRRHIEGSQENFCRHVKNNEDIGLNLLDNLIDEKNTSIFLNAGYKIPGLLNFTIINVGGKKIIVIHNICVPEGEEKGSGKQLIDCVKALASKLEIQKIVLLPIDTSKGFYIKQGFIEDKELNGYLLYEVKGGKKKIKKLRKSRKSRKSRILKRKKNNKITKRKRLLNKKYNLKGGFAVQSVINISYNSDLMESINKALAPIFEILPSFSKDLVYISFGSKLNEPTLEDEYLDTESFTSPRVNTGYQMVPFFLCANSNPREKLLCDGRPCKVLNIVIDLFNSEEQLEASKKYAIDSLSDRREVDTPLDTSNITQFFINIYDVNNGIFADAMSKGKNPYISEEPNLFLGMLSDTFCKKMRENEITPKNYMVVNYIKFKHPNPVEQNTGIKVSTILEKNMIENGYENSYYEWYGYGRMVFYNCIVLKKYIDTIKLGFEFNKFSILKGFEKNQHKIFQLNKSGFKKGEERFRDILKYVYPIKNPYYEIEPSGGYPADNFNNFCYSVYDLMME